MSQAVKLIAGLQITQGEQFSLCNHQSSATAELSLPGVHRAPDAEQAAVTLTAKLSTAGYTGGVPLSMTPKAGASSASAFTQPYCTDS